MFGERQRRSSNVRVMQIFHELKQQFPTIPDHIVTSCITSYVQSNTKTPLLDYLETAIAQEQMGRPSKPHETPSTLFTPSSQIQSPVSEAQANLQPSSVDRFQRDEMNKSVSDVNQNIVIPSVSKQDESDNSAAIRPNTLDIKSDKFNTFGDTTRKLQLSEKCRDVHKLLNSPNFSEKPPRSPLSAKRVVAKNSPTTSKEPPKKETVSTPTQTTDTLVNNCLSPSVNVSFNVNCQMGLVQSPTRSRCTTTAQLSPTQPWLNPSTSWVSPVSDPSSPRSFTSVNLTLRPPSTTPQDPIDITSQNSSLTYSTSSFDRQKGLQSRLQITVGPSGGSVSSVRARPKSSYHPQEGNQDEMVPARAGSLNNLAAVNSEPPVLIKQQARIERMRIELKTENAKLVIMKQEVSDLEKNRLQMERSTDAEVEKQLLMEIKHLRCQCEQLALADKEEEFYNNIYTGQRGPLISDIPNARVTRRQTRGRLYYQGPQLNFPEMEGPKWNCSLCTFLNHPDLDKCEQCEMPRVLHGTRRNQLSNPAFDVLGGQNFTANNLTFDGLHSSANSFEMFKKSTMPNFDVDKSARALRCFSLNNVPSNNNNISTVSKESNNNNIVNSDGLPISTSNSTPNMVKYFRVSGSSKETDV